MMSIALVSFLAVFTTTVTVMPTNVIVPCGGSASLPHMLLAGPAAIVVVVRAAWSTSSQILHQHKKEEEVLCNE